MNYNYQYTRNIGFNLKNGKISQLASLQDEKISWDDLLISWQNIIQGFRDAVFMQNEDGSEKINKKIEIKYPWLKQYAKEYFFSEEFDRTKCKKYTIKEAVFLENVFVNWLERNESLYEKIKVILSQPEEMKSKKADILEIIKIFFSPEYFPFVKDFLKYANDKNDNYNLQQLKTSVDDLETLLQKALFILSPDQSNGVEIAKASFNFYTINKIPKDLDEQLEKCKKAFNSPLVLPLKDIQLLEKVNFIKFLENQSEILEYIPKEKLYEYLKKFRSQEKSKFLEMINQKKWAGKSICSYIKSEFPLFDDKEENIIKFLDWTEKIIKAGNDGNQKEQRVLKIKRGDMFKYYFPKYSKEYCNNIYKKVAMDVGKIKAEIRGIEQEKINARLLKYWAQILKIGSKKVLVLIPKDVISEVKKVIQQFVAEKSDISLISFNSLTLRALDKLIRKNFPKEIPAMNQSDKTKIKLYQKVLRENLDRENSTIDLDLTGYNLTALKKIIEKDFFDNIEDFCLELEKIAYFMQEIFISDECVNELKKQGVIFSEITSYDFERDISGKAKNHTLVWNSFWDAENQRNNFHVRLNPEFKITFRRKIEQPREKQKNRFSKESFRVNFTITENAAQKEIKTAFAKPEDIQKKIEQFNADVIGDGFMKEKGENLYYFGIDRGNQELATLGVVKWTKEEYEAVLNNGDVKKLRKPEFPEILVYSMKDLNAQKEIIIDKKGNKKSVVISKNPSYFMESEEEFSQYFSEEKAAFIDLTTAKVIKEKIILDGDTQTYFNLKKANAKRKLFDVFTKIDPKSNIEFCDDKHKSWSIDNKGKNIFRNSFLVKLRDSEFSEYQILCYLTDEQEKILSRKEMKDYLQEYLEKLRVDISFNETTIEQINNLRDSIAANMVGVVAFLFNQYPAIINLENLFKDEGIQKHFSSNNENIARRLEWALYRKFQKLGLVPPNLKQTIFLKEYKENPLCQFGVINFVKTEKTSGDCPFCGEAVSMKQRQNDKFKEHAYICRNNKNCNFNTNDPCSPLEKIDNSDSVAAYNIAKRGLIL